METISAKNELKGLPAKYAAYLKSPRDRDFLLRVYGRGIDFYLDRLKGIDFVDHEHVLDAGCGFGQWSLALSMLNRNVWGVDVDESRLQVGKEIGQELRTSNIVYLVGSIEQLPFCSETLDAVFSYSTVYQTNYLHSINEFYRVLKGGGKVYLSTNDWGWYLYNLIRRHNPSEDFNPRKYALIVMLKSVLCLFTKKASSKTDLVMPVKVTLSSMEKVGFRNLIVGAEGTLSIHCHLQARHLYASKYFGLRKVYEVIGEK
jgi:ubiquinone/menaquinone biosynthesis C-methylase UbiE